ncbi:Outer membrane protein assembly factor BamA [Rhodospirillaceae bacterium LM-1]|nr:Outer membrane protein assembly factor BamA [Rhodospirillaceae bacterium LM-1]
MCVVAGIAWAGSAWAAEEPPVPMASPRIQVDNSEIGSVIRQVTFQGNQRIEPETIRSYLLVQEGDAFNPERIDRSLKSLFATGLFADVSIKREGGTLLVKVIENPIINRIQLEGNKRVKDETLTPELQMKPRTVYTRTKVQSDVKRLLDIYRRQGRFAATVDPKVIQLDQNRVDLVYEIDEGKRTGVKRIAFVGNKQFADATLREALQTKEERWWRFFSSDDNYDPDRVTYDRELLRRFYMKRGYADFRVVSAQAELSPTQDEFFITFTVEEGERYKIGKVDVDLALPQIKKEDVFDVVQFEKGDWYNSLKVENSVQKITDLVGTKGYAFGEVRPRIERNKDKRTLDITFDIQEGPRVFVERIDITGNVRTLDKVIRREFRLVEGDAFNTAKLRRSRQRLQDLGFFEKVEVNNVPSDDYPDRTIVKVDVQEKSTGELSFGVGWSTTAGALFEIGVRERNLLGRGQDLLAKFSLGQKSTKIDLSFTEPYFMEREVAVGFDLFHRTTDYKKTSSYKQTDTGGSLRAGYRLTEYLSQSVRYGLKQSKVEDVSALASRYIQSQKGISTTSAVSQTLLYDRRDSRLNPTDGYFLRMSNDLAGFGGTERYFRSDFDAGYYYPIAEQWTLALSGRSGYIFGIGKDIRIVDRYFMGGESVRGFAQSGIGPRDKSTDDALGGNWMASGSAEVVFPIGLPNEYGIEGKLFSDVGTLGAADDNDSATVNSSSLIRTSVGFGVNWKSPIGPMSLDFGFPITKENYDETEVFRFNFGTRF